MSSEDRQQAAATWLDVVSELSSLDDEARDLRAKRDRLVERRSALEKTIGEHMSRNRSRRTYVVGGRVVLAEFFEGRAPTTGVATADRIDVSELKVGDG